MPIERTHQDLRQVLSWSEHQMFLEVQEAAAWVLGYTIYQGPVLLVTTGLLNGGKLGESLVLVSLRSSCRLWLLGGLLS